MKEELFYLAGYFEGDGCFRISKYLQKKKNIFVYERSMTITSVCKPTIEFFCNQFNGFMQIVASKERKKTAFVWTIKGKESACLAKKLLPYFISKKTECSLFIDIDNSVVQNNFKKVSSKIREKREALFDQLKTDRHKTLLVIKEKIDVISKTKKTVVPFWYDYIFLAGLADAEGCFRICARHRNRNNKKEKIYNITFEIGNTKIAIIEWLVDRFGGNVTFIEAKKTWKGKRAIAIWAIHSKSLFPILNKIHPFLKNKQAVCEELIKFQQTILPNGGDRHSDSFKKDIARRKAIREDIISAVHILNRKGI